MFLKLYDHGVYYDIILVSNIENEELIPCTDEILQKLIHAKIGEIFPIEFCDDKIFVIKLAGDHVIFRDAIFWVFGIE